MRKDKGLNGDLDRLPMLTWIMFLKFLDDMEQLAEHEAQMAGKRFRPAFESSYRRRDWAAKAGGIAGDELISFVLAIIGVVFLQSCLVQLATEVSA
jgi:type I restriction enzyme M protein